LSDAKLREICANDRSIMAMDDSLMKFFLKKIDEPLAKSTGFLEKRVQKWKKKSGVLKVPEILCRICESMVQADRMIVL
jgi:hypothetical protein